MRMTRDDLTSFFTATGVAPDQADRLAVLAGDLAGGTARPDQDLIAGALRRVAADYVVSRLQSGPPDSSPMPSGETDIDREEAARVADVLVRNYQVLLSNLMACGLYDLVKLGIGLSKLGVAAQSGNEELIAEAEARLDHACAALPEPLVERALTEMQPEVTGMVEAGIETYAVHASEAALGGATLPDHMRAFITSSVLFAYFYDVYPHGPRIIAVSAGRSTD